MLFPKNMNKTAATLLGVLITSIFLLPGINFGGGLPVVRLEDVLVLLLLLEGARRLASPHISNAPLNGYLAFLLLFALWMSVSMLGNGRIARLSDYFEYYKMVKYGILIIFSYNIFSKHHFWLGDRVLYVVFGLLVAFNMANYLNPWSFNQTVMPWYASAERIVSFGKDSMGNPTTRRILGTMGNPNGNGVLWSFIAAYFLVRMGSKPYHLPLFLVAVTMIALAGSRTSFIGILVVVAVYWLIGRRSLKHLALVAAAVLFAFAMVLLFNIQYISMLWTADLMENPSWLARLEVWEHLWGMIIRSPMIGYGPNKEFFYLYGIYSENEYLLMTWRYGFPGLVMYIGLLLFPVLKAWKTRFSGSSRLVIITSTAMVISALTNNPFSEPRLMALYALVVGGFYGQLQYRLRYSQ